ncbi:hypothetical protein VM1G_06320 [Cytospora mali]|uniref:Palmitoyltransferase n=1 Tax=Cytospora mali TaxID=578113 RepID=A0A194W117_CYTMA|nr:hypothetical protein VM1G_06320 [Valsa mali]
MTTFSEIHERIMIFLYGPGWVAWSFAWILCIYSGFTAWSIFYDLAYLQMWAAADVEADFGLSSTGDSSGNKIAAVAIFVVLGLVRLEWHLSWAYAILFSTRWMKERGVAPRRAVMQTSLRFIREWNALTKRSWRGRRPRYCRLERSCLRGDEELGDRVYHCTEKEADVKSGKVLAPFHLPVYDHYCNWIRVIVYLDSMKAYLLTILFLAVDAVIVLALSTFAISHRGHSMSILHAPMSVLATLIITYLAGGNTVKKWWQLAFRNRIGPEEGHRHDHLFAIAVGTRDIPDFIFSTYIGSPWDLGIRGNLTEVLGSTWTWFLFWVRPRRVQDYRKNGYLANQSDFQMSADFMSWVANKRLEHSRLKIATRTARTEEGRRAMGHSIGSAHQDVDIPDRLELGDLTFRRNSRYRLVSKSEGGDPEPRLF